VSRCSPARVTLPPITPKGPAVPVDSKVGLPGARVSDGRHLAGFRWTQIVDGWNRENLLQIGQSLHIGSSNAPNALAYFLGNLTASAALGKCVFCNHGAHGLNYDALGNFRSSAARRFRQ
jgi:hypothetical protein